MRCDEILDIAGFKVEVFRKKNLKNLYIHVDPPKGAVSVKAPHGYDSSEIELFVLKNLPEVIKVKERFESQPRQTEREYVSGEAHYLWGKPYMLQVVYGSKSPSISKEGLKIVMKVPEGASLEERKHLITEWYRKELKRTLQTVSKRCEQKTGVSADELRIKNMKTKWGTCNINERRIWVNLQLVKKPPECLEYVLIHELVHLIEKNHSNRFQALVEEFYPSWKNAKTLLQIMPLDYMEDAMAVTDVD